MPNFALPAFSVRCENQYAGIPMSWIPVTGTGIVRIADAGMQCFKDHAADVSVMHGGKSSWQGCSTQYPHSGILKFSASASDVLSTQ